MNKIIWQIKDKLSNGRRLNVYQLENGMYGADIKDINNIVESTTTQSTLPDIWKWPNWITFKREGIKA